MFDKPAIRHAINLAADHLKRHPGAYSPIGIAVPFANSRHAALLGWVGWFLGMAPGTPENDVAAALNVDPLDFYERIDELMKERSSNVSVLLICPEMIVALMKYGAERFAGRRAIDAVVPWAECGWQPAETRRKEAR